MRYTKSRMHEKLVRLTVVFCSMTTVALTSTLMTKVTAKVPDKAYICETTASEVAESQTVIEINTLDETIDETISEQVEESDSMYEYIRCTVYCDTGYTASGAWTTDGCLAGKREWLGKQCRLYRADKDGTIGDCIGTFEFKDTGFGLEELNGVEYPDGTIMSGASIDMWHPTENECWNWVDKYGDYVYMEFIQ